jgi:DNA repair exonuclease SbcCD ATPase subunit
MTTNETPYRPQAGDLIRINTPLRVVWTHIYTNKFYVDTESGEVLVKPGEFQLISRADGVPVEKVVDLQKENDELRQKLYERDNQIDALRIKMGELDYHGQSCYGHMQTARSERDELRKQLAKMTEDSMRFGSASLPCSRELADAARAFHREAMRAMNERDELRKELAEAVSHLHTIHKFFADPQQGQYFYVESGRQYADIRRHCTSLDAFLARHQAAVDTQQVNHE